MSDRPVVTVLHIEDDDVDGEMLGEDRFEQMFNGKTPVTELFDKVLGQVLAFGEGRPQDDDISILEIAAVD